MPIRISITKPIPFCPSFDPCAKLTPVHVRISSTRIHSGGGWSPFGASYSAGFFRNSLAVTNNSADAQNPIAGEISSDRPTSRAFAQLTPSPNVLPLAMAELARPTPIIDPISVWELDAGSPRNQVPRFQIIDDTSSANTIANPAPGPTLSTSSAGNSATTPNATAPDDVSTPRRLQIPDHTTAGVGLRLLV